MLVSKLQGLRRQNALQQAIQELGRLAKTRHLLAYVDDPALRRRVLVGLNRQERVHAMARAIFFGRQARFPERATRLSSTGRRPSAWRSTPSSCGTRATSPRLQTTWREGDAPSPTACGRTSRPCSGSTCTSSGATASTIEHVWVLMKKSFR